MTEDVALAAKELIAYGRAIAPAIVDLADGGRAVVVPDGYHVSNLPPLEPPLPRIKAAPTFFDLASFIAYVNRYKSEATRIFALPGHLSGGKASVKAVFDYHMPDKADYGVHGAVYIPRYTEEWTRWLGLKPMLQVEFAEFIEENRKDIQKPDAALLLDIVTKFKATKKVEFDAVVYQPDGTTQIAYSDKVENAGKPGVTVPTELELGIPVYFRGDRYRVPVFLRYRVSDGGRLTFTLKVDRADYIEQAAFDSVVTAVVTGTEIEVYLGSIA